MNISVLKYMNLFNTDLLTTSALSEVPMHPPQKLDIASNPSISNLPTTQQCTTSTSSRPLRDERKEMKKLIMLFPSVTFTRTMVITIISFSKTLI
jgi:hypothetical protein